MNPAPTNTNPTPDPHVRQTVRELLMESPAYHKLSPEKQKQVAKHTAMVADYLVKPEGIPANELPADPGAPAEALAGTNPFFTSDDDSKAADEASFEERKALVDDISTERFKASAAREGAAVAGQLLNEVKFPVFVAELIQGVFKSIVTSSIEQMEAYTQMIGAVATSLEKFMEDNVSENQGRDHMVDKFPDVFEIGMDDWGDSPGPTLQLREGVDEYDALKRVNNQMTFENGEIKSLDMSDEQVENALVHNARLQLAKQRQQLMASLVLMGINRIVVTDGRISAKILYDFRASDRQLTRRSATVMDLARDADGNVQTTRSGEGTYDSGGDQSYTYDRGDDTRSVERTSDYYTKGEYKFENKPVVTAMSSASAVNDAQLQTKVQLAGTVDVNFKSDYLPLDKMATPGMIAAIQGNSSPVDPNVTPSARQAPGATPDAAGGQIATPPAA